MANPSRVEGIVRGILGFGAGTYQVSIEVPSRHTRFTPGQFLHLALDEVDPTSGYWPESRVFSIASPPRSDQVEIVYSVKGAFTRRMEAELAIGRTVWLKLPYGSFVIPEAILDQGPVVLVAGGTGVSPYRPFLLQERTKGRVLLFYGVRTPEQILFQQDWERLSSCPWFSLYLTVETGAAPGSSLLTGRLSIDMILNRLGTDGERANFFLSGPPVMIRTFRDTLQALGIEPSRIHIDEWE